MAEQPEIPVLELPAYRAVLSVDVKNFSGLKAVDHHELTEKIPLVLEQAFARAGHAAVWAERRFPAGRGDGYVVGFRPEVLPVLVGPFLDSLQAELAYHHRMRSGGARALRMRVSIAVGPLTDSDDARLGDGSGSAMIETHRLLDCEPVRHLLEDSDPEVTFVAAVLSARVYEDVVVSGYSAKAPTEFAQVPVQVKRYQGAAYLHVPKPSGGLLERGLGPATERPDPAPEFAPPPVEAGGVSNSISGKVGGSVTQLRDQYLGAGGVFQSGGHYTRGDGDQPTPAS
ncbi:hypothetical protein [Amycolatopsis anabasis]|uniref:hypothetical protein n=1 Tax=Amycolatopsis anabasis TaxID=1840409 RepID=UPI00131E10A8|nr:hypothetical protein [Amycolatopsis anabasis]